MLKAFEKAGGGICIAFWDGKSTGTIDMMRKVLAKGQGVFLPEGFIKVDLQKGKGDLKMRYLKDQDALDSLIREVQASNN